MYIYMQKDESRHRPHFLQKMNSKWTMDLLQIKHKPKKFLEDNIKDNKGQNLVDLGHGNDISLFIFSPCSPSQQWHFRYETKSRINEEKKLMGWIFSRAKLI